jgi:glycosyltransferase involved in cell wall biosynthesis
VATTVFDLTAERFPNQVHQPRHTSDSKRRWCERAAVVLAISEHTRDDLIERFAIPPDKVVVTHLGVEAVTPAATHPFQGGPPYLLYVGDRRAPYKNVEGLVRALMAASLPPEVRLVFVGSPRDAHDDELLRAVGWAGRTDVIGADDATLAALYRDALALVYPSRYEGFGLPPLEAMAQGCPVVATTGGAVPEVVGDAALLVDPDDLDAWAEAVHRVVTEDAERARLRSAGYERSARFCWDDTVEHTLAAYRKAVG